MDARRHVVQKRRRRWYTDRFIMFQCAVVDVSAANLVYGIDFYYFAVFGRNYEVGGAV